MNNQVRYLKIISAVILIACLWAGFFTVAPSNVYSSDNNSLDLTVTQFLDSLSFNYKGFDIKVKEVSIGEEFDDNVTYEKKNPKEDCITNMGLGLGVRYEGKTRSLEFLGNVVGRVYAKNTDFNNITEVLGLNFRNEFSEHDRMSLHNDFMHTDEPLFFQSNYFDEQFGRTQGRFEYFRNNFHIDYVRDVSKQLTFITRYDNNVNIFSGTEDFGTGNSGAQNLQNSVLNNPGFDVNYLISSATTSLFSYDFTNRHFEDGGDASINKLTAGIRQYITKKLYFEGRAGVDFIDSFDNENLIKPVIHTSFGYEKDRDTLASLTFDRNDITSPYEEDILKSWRTTLSLSRQLLERLRGSLSLFYSEGKYLSDDYNRRMTGVNSTFGYDINKNLRGNFIYTYSQSNTHSEDDGYTKNTVFLGLSAEF